MPAARSGLRSPVSVASYASRLTAAKRRLIVAGANRLLSSSSRYRRTSVLLNASLGSEQYQETKSSIRGSRPAWTQAIRACSGRRTLNIRDPAIAGPVLGAFFFWAFARPPAAQSSWRNRLRHRQACDECTFPEAPLSRTQRKSLSEAVPLRCQRSASGVIRPSGNPAVRNCYIRL